MNHKVLLGLFFFFLAINAILVSNFLITGRSRSTLEQSSAKAPRVPDSREVFQETSQSPLMKENIMAITSELGGFSVSFSDTYELLFDETPENGAIVSYDLRYKRGGIDNRVLARLVVWERSVGETEERTISSIQDVSTQTNLYISREARIYQGGQGRPKNLDVFMTAPSGNVLQISVLDIDSWSGSQSDLSLILSSIKFVE